MDGAEYDIVSPDGKRIFISYSRRDATFAYRVRDSLRAAGLNLWIDRIGLKPGTEDWEEAIRTAIAQADGVLVVASPESRKSNYVRGELAVATARDKTIFPLWIEGDDWIDAIPLGYSYRQAVDLRGDNYDAGIADLIAALGGITPPTPPDRGTPPEPLPPLEPPTTPSDFVPRNPYKGLSAFRAADQSDFFGRAGVIDELIATLRADPRFLAVIGASGSGKSSVVMAGVLPQLRAGVGAAWVYLEPFVPGAHPVEALSIALAKHLPAKSQAAIDEDLLHPSKRGLHRLAKQITDKRLVLYIDQFEEVFTQTDAETERRQFIDLITTAANEPDSVVTTILTLRADFYDRPLGYSELGGLMAAHSQPILPLALADLYDVILKPAEGSDVRLTFDPKLAEDMVYSVKGEAGALPLLQFTLDQLFQRRDGLRLTQAAYADIGGVRGALAKHAEATYLGLTHDDQQMARSLFLRLIEPGATEQDTTRRRARLSELDLDDDAQGQRLRATAATFVRERLLTTDSAAGEDTIEVSHEALIREWDRLKGWLTAARDDVALMKRLAADAAEWTRKEQPEDSLYRGRRLQEAQAWARANPASSAETAFIAAGIAAEQAQIAAEARRKQELIAAGDRAEQQRRRARWAIGVAAVIILAAVIAFGVAGRRVADADTQVTNADRQVVDANTQVADAETQVADAETPRRRDASRGRRDASRGRRDANRRCQHTSRGRRDASRRC